MAKRFGAAEALDLVPIMNLVTILIPFLLMSAQFVTLAVIDVSAPAIAPPTPDPAPTAAPSPQPLTVAITDQGYTVAGAGAVLPAIPRGAGGAYDTEALVGVLGQAKDAGGHQNTVVIAPESAVAYEVLVATMDASRGTAARPLFDEVVIAGGAR